MHLPHLIGPMQHYLWILKTTHSGADLDTSLEMAKGSLDGGLQWTLYDILNNRSAPSACPTTAPSGRHVKRLLLSENFSSCSVHVNSL